MYGSFTTAHNDMLERNRVLDEMAKKPPAGGAPPSKARYVLFAKLFWSNQSPDPKERVKPNDKAYKADPKTDRVDMAGYNYEPRSPDPADPMAPKGYVNFDYAFWDEASQCFWHANHMEYPDAERQKRDPMKVLQSTRSKFEAGYTDFDRMVFAVAIAENYDPGLAAIVHVRRP